MKCPKCGKIYNDKTSRFCQDCGSRLIIEKRTVTPAVVPTMDPEKGSSIPSWSTERFQSIPMKPDWQTEYTNPMLQTESQDLTR